MIIKKYTKLLVRHSRKGEFKAIATRDFDTEDEWYSVSLLSSTVSGLTGKVWFTGESIPCRKCLCKIKILNDDGERE